MPFQGPGFVRSSPIMSPRKRFEKSLKGLCRAFTRLLKDFCRLSKAFQKPFQGFERLLKGLERFSMASPGLPWRLQASGLAPSLIILRGTWSCSNAKAASSAEEGGRKAKKDLSAPSGGAENRRFHASWRKTYRAFERLKVVCLPRPCAFQCLRALCPSGPEKAFPL